jgi:hypothetical protein
MPHAARCTPGLQGALDLITPSLGGQQQLTCILIDTHTQFRLWSMHVCSRTHTVEVISIQRLKHKHTTNTPQQHTAAQQAAAAQRLAPWQHHALGA